MDSLTRRRNDQGRQHIAYSTRASFLALTALALACGDGGRDEATAPTQVDPSVPTGITVDPSSESAHVPTTDLSGTDSASQGTEGTMPVTTTDEAITTSTQSDPTLDNTATTESTGDAPCAQGDIVCDGEVAQTCDGMGGFSDEIVCLKECAPGVGCVECVPGNHRCDGQVSQVCDGNGYVDEQACDPLQGLSCDMNSGLCIGACAGLGGLSYIGCDYYPVTTIQLLAGFMMPDNPFAVAVANTTAQVANITVTRGGNPVVNDSVMPNSVKAISLPWVDEITVAGGTALTADGAYRLRSDQPVTVYQYNPLNADVTNDASLLLPVNTWTGNYLAAAWKHWDLGYSGFIAVTARDDGTTVTVTPPKGGTATWAGGGIDGTGHGVVVMNEGDVLQILTLYGGDLTGALVNADKPIQLMGGHTCTQVPIGVTACDHLEEAMFPLETLAKEYIVVPPVQVPNDAAEKAVFVRIVAAEANTTLTFDPDQPVNKLLAAAGDFVEIQTTVAKFVVTADKKILVAEYMVGQDAGYGTSDPAMVLAVPSAQFRDNYLFYAQPDWSANYVDIIAPTGATVQVDGAPVAAFTPIGASAFSLAHVVLSNAGDGSHNVSADQKVGITVYGVLDYGSYWYPGGLNLATIPQ